MALKWGSEGLFRRAPCHIPSFKWLCICYLRFCGWQGGAHKSPLAIDK